MAQTHPDKLGIRLSAKGSGLDKYPAKSHARRVAVKIDVTKGLIVLAATPAAVYRNSDQPVPFRQDRYFYFVSGCNEPGCYVTYDIAKDKLVLWLPEIDKRKVVWSGRGSTVKEALERYDVDEAKYITSSQDLGGGVTKFETILKNYITRSRGFGTYIYTLVGSLPDSSIRESLLRARDREPRLQYALNACRIIKDEHEIGLIRKANSITAEAHRAVLYSLCLLKNEAEVEAEYIGVCIARHAKEQAYSPIAGSGSNASVLHYVKNDEDFGDRQMMVLDAGCEVKCYAADVTRSFPLNKRKPGTWPSKEAEEVYKLVAKVQEACIAEMRPGKSFVQITRLAFDMTLDGLLELGVLKGEREEIKKVGTHFAFFPHGLGHHLGLEVHDVAPQAPPENVSPEQWHTDGMNPVPEYRHIHSPDGKARIAFPFQHEGDSSLREYTIRCDIVDTVFAKHSEESITANQIHDCVPGEQDFERETANQVSVALAKLNPSLRGQKDILRRAVECYYCVSERTDGDGHCERCGTVDAEKPDMPPLPPNFDFTGGSPFYTAPPPTNQEDNTGYAGGHDYSILEPGMVVTVEPGLYFNTYLLDNFFLNNPKHNSFIDQDVLKRFMSVGGVRIEDDILVTKRGWENLTTAVKGEEMLGVIREGAAAGANR